MSKALFLPLAVAVLLSLAAPFLCPSSLIPYGPNDALATLSAGNPAPPSATHWLGTDDRGRDVAARLVYALRNSLWFAVCVWLGTLLIGYLFGGAAAYFGKGLDLFGQRFTEIWSSLPLLYVVLYVSSLFPRGPALLILVWVALGWGPLSLYVRGEILALKQRDFILAAKSAGISDFRILWRHLLPHAMKPAIVFSPFILLTTISSLAALDFLGVGFAPPEASFGEMLRQARENLDCWWLFVFPLLILMLLLGNLVALSEKFRRLVALA